MPLDLDYVAPTLSQRERARALIVRSRLDSRRALANRVITGNETEVPKPVTALANQYQNEMYGYYG